MESDLERNITYVVDLVRQNNGNYSLVDFTMQTRLKHSKKNPLNLPEAREAIAEAEKRGLIEKKNKYGYVFKSSFGFDEERYFLAEKNKVE